MTNNNRRIVETATEARAGHRDWPVAYVLVASVALVIVLFWLVYVLFFGKP